MASRPWRMAGAQHDEWSGVGGERQGRGLGHAVLLVALLAGALAALLLAGILEPDPRGHGTHERFGLPPCGLMERFGVPCPGCGVTTSLALAVRGDVAAAFRTQPVGPLLALVLPAAAVWGIVVHLRGRDLARELAARRWSRWLVVGLLVLGVAWLYKLWTVLG